MPRLVMLGKKEGASVVVSIIHMNMTWGLFAITHSLTSLAFQGNPPSNDISYLPYIITSSISPPPFSLSLSLIPQTQQEQKRNPPNQPDHKTQSLPRRSEFQSLLFIWKNTEPFHHNRDGGRAGDGPQISEKILVFLFGPHRFQVSCKRQDRSHQDRKALEEKWNKMPFKIPHACYV
jgi:hypothetical protein